MDSYEAVGICEGFIECDDESKINILIFVKTFSALHRPESLVAYRQEGAVQVPQNHRHPRIKTRGCNINMFLFNQRTCEEEIFYHAQSSF